MPTTTMSEVAAVEIVPEDPSFDAPLNSYANPFEDIEDYKALTKQYQVGHYTWAYGTPVGAFGGMSFPAALFAIPNIARVLTPFKYFRSDVEVETRITATPFHIGTLSCSHVSSKQASYPPINDWRLRQNLPNLVNLKVNQVNAETRVVRRTFPLMWDEIHDPWGWETGTYFLDIRDKLAAVQTGEPASITVCVYARFINPKTAGYIGSGFAPPTTAADVRKLVKSYMDLSDSTHKKSKKMAKNPPAKEAEEKSSRGVISGIAEAIGTLPALLLESPLPELAPIAYGIGKTAPFFRSLGLSKPSSTMATQPVSQDPYRDLVHTHGLAQGNVLAAHPEAMLGDLKMCDLRRHTFKELIQQKCFLSVHD